MDIDAHAINLMLLCTASDGELVQVVENEAWNYSLVISLPYSGEKLLVTTHWHLQNYSLKQLGLGFGLGLVIGLW